MQDWSLAQFHLVKFEVLVQDSGDRSVRLLSTVTTILINFIPLKEGKEKNDRRGNKGPHVPTGVDLPKRGTELNVTWYDLALVAVGFR
jgi:hypothetical protein